MSRENKEKAQVILKLIVTSGMTYKTIAATLPCDPITVWRWASEKSPTAPTDATIAQLRGILAARAEWILRGFASLTAALNGADAEAAAQVARQAAPAAMDLAALLVTRADADRDGRRAAWAEIKAMAAAGLTADQVLQSLRAEIEHDGGFVIDPADPAAPDAK